jgi:cytochrome c oxidase subunit 1
MASTPVDIFIHDTYFIVAHFHYVVAGIIFALFAAVYYWFPKMFYRRMNDTLGNIHFVLTYIFFNGAFFPMHFLGVGGHMRRIYNPTQYEFLMPMQHWNVFITVSALILGASQIFFYIISFTACLPARRRSRTLGRRTRSNGRRPHRLPMAISWQRRPSIADPTNIVRLR